MARKVLFLIKGQESYSIYTKLKMTYSTTAIDQLIIGCDALQDLHGNSHHLSWDRHLDGMISWY